jgi:RNA polymerase sigma-70 factor (ECF subfamily)
VEAHQNSFIILPLALVGSRAAASDKVRVPTIDDLLTINSVGSVKISPDGKWVAYTVSQTDLKADAYINHTWIADPATGRCLLAARLDRLERSKPATSSAMPAWCAVIAPRSTTCPPIFYFAQVKNPRLRGIIIVFMGPRELGMPLIEPATLGRLYRQHAPALRLYARQWADSAEDLIQDAFVRLACQAPPPEQVLPWLYRVIRNQALTNYRSETQRRQRERRSNGPVHWFASVDSRLEAQEAKQMLGELPLDLREVVVARLWGGLTFAEVAELVGCSLATAHRYYEAGLTQLRERLEGQWKHLPSPPTI